MNQDTLTASMCSQLKGGVKLVPLVVLMLVWLWILLFVAIIGLNTSTFHSLFGWTAMMPHI